MALILKDRVQETSTTTGTGTLTLAGAVTQFQTFSSAVGNGNTTYYTIYNAGGSLWEVGIGTVGAGTLARTTVLASSNAGSLVSFTGTLYVFCDYPASKSIYANSSGNVDGIQITNSAINSTSIGGTTPADGAFDVLSSNAGNINATLGATTPNAVTGTDITATGGVYAKTALSASYTDGVVLDYVSGQGRISVGTGDSVVIYNGGVATTKLLSLNSTGALGVGTSPSYGTSGQVLTSGGTGAAPTWTTPSTGTVTSVIGTAPVVSSGGNTPAISMAAANTTTNGYLTSTDWNTFNNKGSGSVTSVSATVPSIFSVSGVPITGSGTIAMTYSGTALPAANGGTGLTSPGTSGNVLTSNGTGWVSSALSAAATPITQNLDIVSTNQTIAAGSNGFSVGPMTINSGVSVTVASGQRWVVI